MATSLQIVMRLERGEDELPRRVLRLTEGSTVHVGRASKTERKHLMPSEGNCWIRNPVISRNHAVLSRGSKGEQALKVYIEDFNSSHGTHLNGSNIRGLGKRELRSGDKVIFGDEVQRADVKYDPPVFGIAISSNHDGNRQEPVPMSKPHGRTYSFPDDLSDGDEDEFSDSQSQEEEHGSKPAAPGSTANNPVTVEEDDDDAVIWTGTKVSPLAQLTTKVHDNPAPLPEIELVHDTYSQDEFNVDIDVDEDGDEESMNLEDEGTGFNPTPIENASNLEALPYAALSPIYTPTSPKWQSSYKFGPDSMSMHDSQPTGFPPTYKAPPQPTTGSLFEYHPQSSYLDEPYFKLVKEAEVHKHTLVSDHSGRLPSTAQADRNPELNTSGLTVTTSELLNTSRLPTPKNDMAIENHINPQSPAVARTGDKRKAAEISEDHIIPHQDTSKVPEALDAEAGSVHDGVGQDQTPVHSHDQMVAHPSAHTEYRPRKRLLRDFGVLALGSALGGLGVLAGLVALPDSVFQ